MNGVCWVVDGTMLFPIFALFLWGGLYLRDRRVRALIPFRSGG
ncbi:MAG: hypothetical protein ABI469_09000 [Gemmatimonadales bacterium]